MTFSVAATLVMRALVGLATAEGGDIEVGPLWVSTAASLPLLFMFVHETDVDRASPRSLALRRGILLSIAGAVTGVLSLACFPQDMTGLGFIATWRNCLGLVGLGLLGMGLVGPSAIWVAPTLVAIMSMMFAWPWKPALHHGIWGALRAPGNLTFATTGVPNLSIPLCLSIAAAGVVTYLRGCTLSESRNSTASIIGSRVGASASAPRWQAGLGRASLQTPLMTLGAIVCAAVLWGDIGKWGGSPRLLFTKVIPSVFFFLIPIGAVVGVICGQARWRSGLNIWQSLSSRSNRELLARASCRAMLITLVALSVPALVLSLVAAVSLAGHVPNSLVATELVTSLPPTLVVIAGAMVLAAAGTMLGWCSGRIWLAPLGLILALALMIAIPLDISRGPNPDNHWADRYGYTSCTTSPSHRVRVCSTPPNSAYLPAAAARIDEIYTQSPAPKSLPRIIHLESQGTLGKQPPGTISTPTIGIGRDRGMRPPNILSGAIAESLVYSTQAWCPGTQLTDIQIIYAQQPPEQTLSMNKTIQLLDECRQ